VLDAELRDPARRVRSSRRYGGFILAGGAQVGVDRINLLRSSVRATPEPAALGYPGDGAASGLSPELSWAPSLDPNLGQTVRYAVQISTSPSMAGADSVVGVETCSYTPSALLEPLTTYYWRVRAYDTTGRGSVSTVRSFITVSGASGIDDPITAVPSSNALHPATPNPFNPGTRLSFRLASAGRVRLSVYDVSGRLVARLVDDQRGPGEHSIWWNGTDQAGRRLSSGVYLLRLESGAGAWSRKLVLAR